MMGRALRRATLVVTCLMSAGSASAQTDAEVAARLTPTVHACESAPENGGTLQQAICYRDEATRQDRQLNDVWRRAMARTDHRRDLRRTERQWIKDRDAECKSEAADYVNSTAAYMFNSCLVDETIRRIIWLEKRR
jgi:uncharacterized protein YecT (DUF1311 family)